MNDNVTENNKTVIMSEQQKCTRCLRQFMVSSHVDLYSCFISVHITFRLFLFSCIVINRSFEMVVNFFLVFSPKYNKLSFYALVSVRMKLNNENWQKEQQRKVNHKWRVEWTNNRLTFSVCRHYKFFVYNFNGYVMVITYYCDIHSLN